MAFKKPFEYELSPREIDPGTRWITLRLKNVGDQPIKSLDLRLNSLDTYSISVQGLGRFWGLLAPGEEMEFPFQVIADSHGRLYGSVDGWQDGERFHWESPGMPVSVGGAAAELISVSATARAGATANNCAPANDSGLAMCSVHAESPFVRSSAYRMVGKSCCHPHHRCGATRTRNTAMAR